MTRCLLYPEAYYYSLVLTHIPFRAEEELLDGFNTAKEAFWAKRHRLCPLQEGFDAETMMRWETEIQQAISRIVAENLAAGTVEEQNDDANDNNDVQPIEHILDDGGHNIMIEEVEDEPTDIGMPDNQFETFVASLNMSQRQLFQKISQKLQRERQKWRHMNWLIIDEISMVPYLTLRNIHIRLQQLKQDQGNFGGINVILFGDLMQLPPVSRITGGSYCFRQPSNLTGETNLWQLFSFCELPQNMRQAGDNTFVDILNNIRVGELTMDQLEILDSRRIPLEAPFADGEAVRIFPTTKQVDAYNSAMTKKLGKSLKLYQINAVDISLEAKTYGQCPRKQYISDDPNKTGGILGTLTIGIGSRVMLRRNINVNHGLVNGAMGIIRRIEWPSLRREQLEP
ncbi:hypothetical protein HW555_012830, partial [Spodoptera exigua]